MTRGGALAAGRAGTSATLRLAPSVGTAHGSASAGPRTIPALPDRGVVGTVLAHPDPVVRGIAAGVLDAGGEPGVGVAAQVDDLDAALALLDRRAVDVVVVGACLLDDARLPRLLDAVAGAAILVLADADLAAPTPAPTSAPTPAVRPAPAPVLTLAEAMRAGVRACVSVAAMATGDLGAAVATLRRGGCYVSPALAPLLLDPRPPGSTTAASVGGLSAREAAVVALIAEGLTNAEVADRLGIIEKTVKNHITRAYAKLGATCRHEAVRAWRAAASQARHVAA